MDGYFPQNDSGPTLATFIGFNAWNNERGAEVVFGGCIQFVNFVVFNNQITGIEFVDVSCDGDNASPYGTKGPG